MSARIINPATVMMAEVSHKFKTTVSQASSQATSINNSSQVYPNPLALARVRRDLFGPVDHAATKALAERELKAQSILDAEKWNFDFRLEVPIKYGSSRFHWEPVSRKDCVPQSYQLRGMPYLRRNLPSSPKTLSNGTSGMGPIKRSIALQAVPRKRIGSLARKAVTSPSQVVETTFMATFKNKTISRKGQSNITGIYKYQTKDNFKV